MIRKITPDQAAQVMGCSAQFIRIGLQRGLLDIGDAVKMSSKWTYNKTACPDRCPFKDRTACIWLAEGKEHDTEENETGTGEEDPDLH